MVLHFAFFIGTIKYSPTLRLSNEYNQPSLREVLLLLFEREIKGLNKNFCTPFQHLFITLKKRILSSNELAMNSLVRAAFNYGGNRLQDLNCLIWLVEEKARDFLTNH